RGDTIYGVTFLVMAPEHPLVPHVTNDAQKSAVVEYQDMVASQSLAERQRQKTSPTGVFTGTYAYHPLTHELLPIWLSDYVLIHYGKGAIMAVPADDERDSRFAEYFSLPVKEDHKQGTPLESLDQKQGIKYVEKLLAKCGRGYSEVSYRIRDAIFSRQRYWGEPIPIYYQDGVAVPFKSADLPLELPKMAKYEPSSGEPPLAKVASWQTEDGYPIESSTMPGFAGSSGYYLRYMDPHNGEQLASPEALNYWQDVDIYIGGAEHATGHLIYARFWNMFLYDLGVSPVPEPFKKLINQGMILGESQYIYRIKGTKKFVSYGLKGTYDTQRIPVNIQLAENGVLNTDAFRSWRPEFADAEFILESGKFYCDTVVEKMSKSLFNTVTPDEIIFSYGADTLRLYEMFLGPIDQTKPWSLTKITGVHRFLKRFWRLFFTDNKFSVSDDPLNLDELKLLHTTVKNVVENTAEMRFNVAISHFMEATNELTKSRQQKKAMLEPLVILLAPFCPHICEELYQLLGGEPSIFRHGKIPAYDPQYTKQDLVELPVAIGGKVKFKIHVPPAASDHDIEQEVRSHPMFNKIMTGKNIKKWIIRRGKIVNLVVTSP
ncbi:MAG: class I tRNA ligase family protein, partial [Proteobacteria bacterium]|nr:class I tRNA ligase family protein [Pseudomonadota bacterium]